MEAYRIFTVTHGSVFDGARVEVVELRGAGVSIAAVTIGEEGRNRVRGVLPVAMSVEAVEASTRIFAAAIGKTRSGAPKLIPAEQPTSDDYAIVVLIPVYGYRGSVQYDGIETFDILSIGKVADGMAGRMAENKQYILLVPRGAIWRTIRTGRLYGGEPTFDYVFTGDRILYATPEQRAITDIF